MTTPDEYERIIDVLLDTLQRVMSTLSKSAGSPEEAAVWREARAVLAEYGRRS